MPVWWGTFAYAMVVSIIGMFFYKSKKASATLGPVEDNKTEQYRSIGLFFALLTFALLAFFVGNRTFIHDTQEYQYMYDIFYTDDLNQITEIVTGKREVKGPIFVIYMVLFKHFTHGTSNDWLMSIAVFQSISLALFFYKYSVNFAYSIYLFFTTSVFIWMVNGMRQFIAVTIILFAMDWLVKKKTILFFIIVLIAFWIHSSAIIWIPVFFIIQLKPWSKKMLVFTVLFVFAVIIVSRSPILNNTDYDYLLTDEFNGINPFRLAVSMVPPVLAFIRRDAIEKESSPLTDILINISMITAGCYIVGMFTNGVAARIAGFFDIYSLLLLPWLLKNAFDESMGKSITIASFIGYFIYFLYNMYGARNGVYQSDILGLNYWV